MEAGAVTPQERRTPAAKGLDGLGEPPGLGERRRGSPRARAEDASEDCRRRPPSPGDAPSSCTVQLQITPSDRLAAGEWWRGACGAQRERWQVCGLLNLGLLLTIDLRPQVLCCCTCLPGAQRVSSAAGVVRGTGQVLRDRSCTRARAAGHCGNGTVVLGWDERAPSRLLRPLRPLMLSACADGDTEPPHAASSGFRGRCLPQVRLSDLPGHSSTDWKQSSNDGTSRFWQ